MPNVKSAMRVFSILELIAEYKGGLRHSAISENLGIPTSSLSALLSNMVESQYLTLDHETKRYTLGSKTILLAGKYLKNLDVVQISKPLLKEATTITGESTGLSIKSGKYFVMIHMERTSKPIQHYIEIGTPTPLHVAAAGKAILAHCAEEEINRYLSSVKLKAYTKNTLVDPDAIRTELREIRESGIALSHGEIFEDVHAVGTPIFNMSREAFASIAVSYPVSRRSNQLEKTAKELLIKTSKMISEEMGFFTE